MTLKSNHRASIIKTAAVLLAGSLYFLFFWKRLLIQNLIPLSPDTLKFHIPSLMVGQDMLIHHFSFLWESARNMGQPFLATPQNEALYPIRLLSILMTVFSYQRVFIVLHVLLATLFGYLLGRQLYKAQIPALFLGLELGFNGFFFCRSAYLADFAAIAWLPCVVYFLIREKPVALGVALCFQWMAGLPTYSVLGWGACLLMAGLSSQPKNKFNCLVQGMAIFLGLSAVQILPFLEVLQESMRGVIMSAESAFVNSVPPSAAFKQMILPFFMLGDLSNPDFLMARFYLGPLALILIFIALFKGDRRKRLLVIVAVFFLVMSLGPANYFYEYIPFIRIFRYPSQWLFLFTFFASVVAAYGLSFVNGKKVCWFFIGLTLFDLGLFSQGSHFIWASESWLRDSSSRLIGIEQPAAQRIFHTDHVMFRKKPWALPSEAKMDLMRDILSPSIGVASGFRETSSHHSLTSKRNIEYVTRLNHSSPDSPLFDYAGISTIVGMSQEGSLKSAPDINDFGVIKNLDPKPHVFMANSGGAIQVTEDNPGHIRFEAEGPGQVVVSESAFPGWRLYVDGKREDIELFENYFLAKTLLAGRHQIYFRYLPNSFLIGLGISLTTLVLLLVLQFLKHKRPITRPVEIN